MPPSTQVDMLTELEPVVGRELDRHLSAAREWFPHEYVLWSDGRAISTAAGRRCVGSVAISSE
jgi:acyl-[acyl-carrier-protein] desaturase